MKVWITKYALTQGILEIEAEECTGFSGMIKVNKNDKYYHGEGKEWHRTYESAIFKAEEMRKKKIASLLKQIKKLEEINFN